MNRPLLYERWLEEIQSGVAEPPVSLQKYQRMGIDRKIEFLSGLGFSEHFAEELKARLFESDEFDLAIFDYADGSGLNGNVRALKALNSAHDRIMTEAADELESVLENMQPVRRRR